MDIILFGMQGSGKGTQGKILAEKYNLRIFEMGAELRKTIESGTTLGNKIKDVVAKGDLVNDDTIMMMIENFMQEVSANQPILFDGIPRTSQQSKLLLGLLNQHGRDAFALLIKISEKEAMKRLTQRRICQNCKAVYPAFYKNNHCGECNGTLITRQDDNAESIKKRLENYQKETLPVIKGFYEIDHLIEVDGEQLIPDVTEEMIEKAEYLFS